MLLESTLRKIFDFIIERFMLEKDVYYPANIEPIIERHQWNRWLIIGWCVYFVINYNTTVHLYVDKYIFLGFIVLQFIFLQHFS